MKKQILQLGKYLLLAFNLFIAYHGFSQHQETPFYGNGSTGTLTVSGTQIVNSYYPVTSVTGSSLTATGFSPSAGDRVLIIQMTGPYAGNWTWDTVTSGGNPCTVYSINNSGHTIDPGSGLVQAVAVPQYTSLIIPSGAILTAAPWNGTTGGILTFMVKDTFTIQMGGKCDVSGLGFSPGITGVGGGGGVGGAGGAIGQPGGDSLQVYGSGIGGGGNGGQYGQQGYSGTSPILDSCTPCGIAADNGGANLSNLQGFGYILNTNIQLGGAGQSGAGGAGGSGGGGGGGGTASAGTAGSGGGDGGDGGMGGSGAGVIVFSAYTLSIPATGISFIADGLDGASGLNGTDGLAGGNGGAGATPCNAGGGGSGGRGGNGGGGGGGGGGGVIVALVNISAPNLTDSTVEANGGLGASGGHGGPGGPGGHNGGPVDNTCSGTAVNPPYGPDGANGFDGGGGSSGGNGGLGVYVSDCANSIPDLQSIFTGECGDPYLDANQIVTGLYPDGFVLTSQGYCVNSGAFDVPVSVYATDENGCFNQTSNDIVFTDNGYDLYNLGQTTTSCLYESDGMYQGQVALWSDQGQCNPQWDLSISGPGGYSFTDSGTSSLTILSLRGLVTGIYSYSVTGNGLCPIINTGDFTISSGNNPVYGYETDTICPNSTYSWNGASYNLSGSYTDTIRNGSLWGCDSIDNLNLVVLPALTANNLSPQYTGNQCGISFDPTQLAIVGGDGQYQYQSDSINTGYCISTPYGYDLPYQIMVTDGHQCTAQFYTDLIYVDDQFDFVFAFQTDASCPAASDGSYTGTITDLTNMECNAGWTLSIYGTSTSYAYTNSGIGSGNDITLTGLSADTYNYSITGLDLCSQVTSGSFSISADINPISGNEYDTICYNGSLTWHGNTYDQSTAAFDTLAGGSLFGCDSIAQLHLTVLPQILEIIYDTIVIGNTIQVGGHSYSQAGTYADTLNSIHGCDSVIHLHLYIDTPATFSSVYDSICPGFSVRIGANSYSQAGIHTDTLVNHWGGDSVVTLHLTIYPSPTVSMYDTVFIGDTLHIGSHSYSQAGTYADTLNSIHGCDSVIHLHLYIDTPATVSDIYDTICLGSSIIFGNKTYTSPGSYVDTLTNHTGGDSIVTLYLYVSSSVINIYDTICQGSSVKVGPNVYTQPGVYPDTLITSGGCDSIRILNLAMTALVTPSIYISVSHGPVVADMQIDTFTASYTNCTDPYFNWYQNILPLGMHGPVVIVAYPAGQADSFLCNVICSDQCAAVTSIFSNSIYVAGMNELTSLIRAVNIYPNPTQGSFGMDITTLDISDKEALITITNLIGQPVLSKAIIIHSGSNKETLSLSGNAAGVYIVQLTVEGQSVFSRILLDK